MNNQYYDVILIGSGIGSLAAAAILSKMYSQKVLVLEQHFKSGGFTHVFKRKGGEGNYTWDVGVHYIGGMESGSQTRAVFDYITGGRLKWKQMPEVYDVFMYPNLTFKSRAGTENLKSDLLNRFPDEAGGIENYFADVKKAGAWFTRHMVTRAMFDKDSFIAKAGDSIGAELARKTTAEYLDEQFKSEELKAVLVSQWGDYGLPPGKSSFLIHAMITSHYFEGGYYPAGGAKSIGDGCAELIRENGGEILVNHEVEKIVVENGAAVGVEVLKKEKKSSSKLSFSARQIISGAGAFTTYQKLLPKELVGEQLDELNNSEIGISDVTLYIGFKESPEKLGFTGENYWIYDTIDHDEVFESGADVLNGNPKMAYLSFPSLKDGQTENHTCEIISLADYDDFAKWKDQPWKNRDEEYQQLKKRISDGLISYVEKRFPGFGELIDYAELSTPLSSELFTKHPKGTIYGVPSVPEKFFSAWNSPRTPIKNLFLTGSDAGVHGVVGAMMAGVVTAGLAAGSAPQILRIFSQMMKYSKGLAGD